MAHQVFEQIEFTRRQLDPPSGTLNPACHQVDVQVTDFQTHRRVAAAPTQQKA
jgi:hypothetical protein